MAQYNAKVEPCRYWCYLIIGVILGVWAIYFQVHIWGAGALDNYGIQVSTLIDRHIEGMRLS